MHILKNKIVAALFVSFALGITACAGTAEQAGNGSPAETGASAQEKNAQYEGRQQDKQAMLESMFQNFLSAVRNGSDAETLYGFLTDTSEYWLDTLENHAKVYNSEALDTCQFYTCGKRTKTACSL